MVSQSARRQRRAVRLLGVLFLVSAAAPAHAGGVHFGVRAGVPVTEYFDTTHNNYADYTATTRRYVVGPTIEYQLTDRFGVAADLLFTRMGYVGYLTTERIQAVYDAKGDSWDVPVMLRCNSRARFRPFLGGGFVMRYIGPVRATGQLQGTPIDTAAPSDLRKRWYPGLTLGGGVVLSAGPIRIEPECRYVRWTANIAGPGGLVRFGPNQVMVLVGIGR